MRILSKNTNLTRVTLGLKLLELRLQKPSGIDSDSQCTTKQFKIVKLINF